MFEFQPLNKWYLRNQREFPWRVNPDPYWVWIAEIMSQQTQMATLIPYFERFLKNFPKLKNLANATEESVLQAWAGLGYYSRARNLHKTAKILHKQGIPKNYEGWLALPGVGPYTAAAVVSQCFGVKQAVWDGNVQRVCSRLFLRADVFQTPFKTEMLELLNHQIQKANASVFNQSLMELGALICTPKKPICERCPLNDACLSYRNQKTDQFPPPKPRKTVIELKPRVWVCLRKNKYGSYEAYLVQRKPGQWFSGLWDFPTELGGVKRPILEQAHQPPKANKFGVAKHSITHHKIELQGHVSVALKPTQMTSGRWIDLDLLIDNKATVPVSTTAKKLLRPLMRYLNEQTS